MARIVTVRRREGAEISVRRGRDAIGFVTRLEGGDELMRGHFAAGPGYNANADLMTAADASAREQAGIHVFSGVHDMRIDEEESVVLAGDEIRFKPAAAFLTLRSGGLG